MHDGPAEESLVSSLLLFVRDDRHTEQLREVLSGFSHRCRNLLNGMKMSLYFVRRGAAEPLPPRWDEVETTYRAIEQLFDHLQTIYRPISLTLIRAPFGALVQDREREWRDWLRAGGGTLEILPPARESPGEFDAIHLSLGLDALLSWRCSLLSGDQMARLSWRTNESDFEVSWQESRAFPRRHGDRALRPCGKPATASRIVQSLAIPLLARVVTAHRGLMELSQEPEFKVVLRWPLNQPERSESPSC
jgi:hypothetical protein